MRHSYSALQTLALCERKWALRHVEELEADRPDKPKPLRGTAWHAVVQSHLLSVGAHRRTLLVRPEKLALFRGHEISIDWTDPFAPTIAGADFGPEVDLCPEAVIAHYRSWWNHQESDYRDEMLADYGAPLPDRLLDLWHRYHDHYGREDDLRYDTLLTEYEWSRAAPNGKLLQGRVDAVLFDNDLNLVVTRDYKTHEAWPTEPDHVVDLMDSQLQLQAWGVAPVLRAHDLVPQAVQFDRLRFKKPTEPKLTTKGALSKSVTDFDAWTYTRWCLANDQEVDPAVVAACDAKTDAWFRRSQKPLSIKTITAHVLSAQAQVIRAESIDPKTAALVPSKACSWCEFLPLCRAEIIGGRPEDFIPQDFNLRKKK